MPHEVSFFQLWLPQHVRLDAPIEHKAKGTTGAECTGSSNVRSLCCPALATQQVWLETDHDRKDSRIACRREDFIPVE